MDQPGDHDYSALAKRVMDGDDDAFEELYETLGGWTQSVLLKLGAGSAALDLNQDVWVDVWKALRNERYDPTRAKFKTYVAGFCLNAWRRHRRAKSALPDQPDPQDLAVISALSELELAEVLEAIRDCFRRPGNSFSLTVEERRILEDTIVNGKTMRTVASEMGIPLATLHMRKQKALDKLRKCLRGKGHPLD